LVVVSHDVNTMPAAAFHRIKLGQPLAGLLRVQQSESMGSIIKSPLLIWQAPDIRATIALRCSFWLGTGSATALRSTAAGCGF
jgi:hypothetical protein